MNSVPLRRMIRKYGNVGYALVGFYLLGYWLFHFKRRQTLAALTLALLVASTGVYIGAHLTPAGEQCKCIAAQSYVIHDLGVIGDYQYSFGQSLNAKGQTTGFLADEEFEKVHGFFCTSGGSMTDIGSLGGDVSFTYGINDDGQVVGTSVTASEDVRGFVWQNGKMTRIGTLGGQFSFAEGINNKGQAVGISDTSRGLPHAFLWQDGAIKDIGGSCPGRFNGATAINDNSDVAGVFTNDGETVQSFVLSGNKARALPTLGGKFTLATAISGKAHVVGLGTLKGDEETVHGFAWQTGGIQDIGTLGGENSFANGVNNQGTVAGSAETKSGMLHAIIWQNGKLTDLNTLLPGGSGWELLIASGINDNYQIVGTGIVGNKIHAFLMTPQR